MMKSRCTQFLCLICLIALYACTNSFSTENKQVAPILLADYGKTQRLDTLKLVNSSDSLRMPHHKAYLSDLTTAEMGHLLLKKRVAPLDNSSTFRVMDSLTTPNLQTRPFYFEVFNVIMAQSDGALSETVGKRTFDFLLSYSPSFAQYALKLSDEQLENWANYVGLEILLSADAGKEMKSATEYSKQFSEACATCSQAEKKRLTQFNEYMSRVIQMNVK